MGVLTPSTLAFFCDTVSAVGPAEKQSTLIITTLECMTHQNHKVLSIMENHNPLTIPSNYFCSNQKKI